MLLRAPYPTAAAATAWTPANLPAGALQGWWDARETSTVTVSGGKVSSIAGRNGTPALTQATAAAQPSYPGNINGRSAVAFSGAQGLSVSQNTTGVAVTVMCVVWMQNAGDSYGRIYSVANGGAEDFNNQTSFSTTRFNGTSDLFFARNNVFKQVPFGYDNAGIIATIYDGANGVFYTNGTVAATQAETSLLNSNMLSVGRGVNGNDRWAGMFGEMVKTNTALSTNDRQKLEGYLAHGWGTQAMLPAGHPYRNSPPTV